MTDLHATHYREQGRVAVIELDNPPVNSLGLATRRSLLDHLKRAWQSEAVKAIVIAGRGKLFSGGADITEFETPRSRAEPVLRSLVADIERSSKPIIAALHGATLGGGLELALACQYRIAAPDSRFGLPEVKLGLLPGGGGTQRLTRLVGVEAALSMIVSGQPVDTVRALQLGLVNEVPSEDLVGCAVTFADRIADDRSHPRASQIEVNFAGSPDFFARKRVEMQTRNIGQAPIECIACVEAAVTRPFEDGLAFERERFQVLLDADESRALRHLFFAERVSAKPNGLGGQASARDLRRVGVVGAGMMGGGIAMSFANAGLQVVLLDVDQSALDRGMAAIRRTYESALKKGALSQADFDRRLSAIVPTLDDARLGDVDLAIEAVFEDMAVKKATFERLDRICKQGAVLATNTSRLDVDEIAAFTKRPSDVVGLHFFSPANMMRLVEVVRGAATSPDVLKTAVQISRRIGKLPVVVGVCDGFVGNRMVAPYGREAEFLLEEGASPGQVDAALRHFGLAMGRFAMADLAGLDIGWAIRKAKAAKRSPELRYSNVADSICELGRFGQKTGAGYFRYEAGSRHPLHDPLIDTLIAKCAADAGIARRDIEDDEIVERTVYALVNEGAKILEEGVVPRASDIDLIYVNGYGFPAWRGGPMFYADTVGLDKVVQRIRAFHAEHGDVWRPAPLLERLVADGIRLADYRPNAVA